MGIVSPKESFGRGKAAAVKALELEKDLAEAHCSLAYALHHYDWDWANAEREFLRSLELNPGYATGHHWHALLHVSLERTLEAVAELEKAQELDPLAPILSSLWASSSISLTTIVPSSSFTRPPSPSQVVDRPQLAPA
jgi:tetratricopeptide (TPR) repeat protein